MKILLLGEFSGLYTNLKDGLTELGHEVVLASDGDGYKKFNSDIFLKPRHKNYGKIINRILYVLKTYFIVKRFKDYDVVQLVYDHLFYPVSFNKFITNMLIKNNRSLFLNVAGSNSTVMRYWLSKKNSKVSILYQDALKYDGYNSIMNDKLFKFEKQFTPKVNGIIPIMYEYSEPYYHCKNLRDIIPIPINLKKIKFKDNLINNKLVFFHGLNKYGSKGTKYIEEAFKIVAEKYPKEVEVIIAGNLKYDDYLILLNKANVVLDQTSSYSIGINGLVALAMGKVVMGGAEKESYNPLGYEECPVINLRPDVEYIVSQMELVIKNKHEILKTGEKSREFVEKYHGHLVVAKKYVDLWEKNLKKISNL